MKKVDFLRKKYPRFIYKKYNYKISNNNLEIVFDFQIEPDPAPPNTLQKCWRYGASILFKPKIVIENVRKSQIDRVGERVFNNLVFHLGLIEIPSYWKATCSPEIIIEAGPLNKEQTKWWKDLILKGMGQFFYENKVNFKKKSFLKIFSKPKSDTNLTIVKNVSGNRFLNISGNRFLVPIGGGRDSIVTLEKLKEERREIGCFLVNPTKVMKDVVIVSNIKDKVVVWRKIDPLLLELNKKGFLNGHTPITAVLSFLSVFCAILFNYQNIIFSNEKSANEGNLRYLGRVINHQWSKSSEFEKKFRDYCQKYLVKGINYFSFLRRYSELEISRMFTKYPQYFPVFSSCNVVLAKKLKRRWCGNCAKCLFVYATLYPFLEKEEILKIFGQDIFENKKLLSTMKGLINPKVAKPFECVGSKRESKAAFKLSFNKAKKEGQVPYLLRRFDILK